MKPYILARQFSTLDHVTEGRCGWNIVTSHTNSSAQALGFDNIIAHDERYAMAEEYMDVVYKLWESSWADDSVVWAPDLAFDPAKINKIEHKGKHFSVLGRNQVHPSPQRTPVLFQAGTSKSGTAFAARHAEAIFMNPATTKLCKAQIASARAEAKAQGRDPSTLKFFPCIVPIIGRTEEEAKAKYEKAKGHGDMLGGLAQFSGYTGIDMSLFPLDEPFTASSIKGGAAIQAVLSSFEASVEGADWTPRRLGEKMALASTEGYNPCVRHQLTCTHRFGREAYILRLLVLQSRLQTSSKSGLMSLTVTASTCECSELCDTFRLLSANVRSTAHMYPIRDLSKMLLSSLCPSCRNEASCGTITRYLEAPSGRIFLDIATSLKTTTAPGSNMDVIPA